MGRIKYYFDDIDISTLNITIAKSSGVLDRPRRKSVLKTDWSAMNGNIPDLETNCVEERTLKLEGFITAANRIDFAEQINNFADLIGGTGYHRLTIEIDGVNKPLIYIVYSSNGLTIDKTWRQGNQVGTFSLTLTEPYSVKRILQLTANSATTLNLTITSSDEEDFDIFWGDKSHSVTNYGTTSTLNHTYSEEGSYFVVICGNIDKITSIKTGNTEITIATNPKIVWPKI